MDILDALIISSQNTHPSFTPHLIKRTFSALSSFKEANTLYISALSYKAICKDFPQLSNHMVFVIQRQLNDPKPGYI